MAAVLPKETRGWFSQVRTDLELRGLPQDVGLRLAKAETGGWKSGLGALATL